MNRESLSALFDGECSSAELDRLLDGLDREPALKAEWSRLCLARDARATTVRNACPDFAAGVMAAIAVQTDTPRATVIPFPQRVWRATQPLVGYALAASVGAFAVFGVMAPKSDGDTAEAPVQFAQMAEPYTVAQGDADEDPVSSYLMDHSARSRAGMGGSLGYARVAAHRAVYRREADVK